MGMKVTAKEMKLGDVVQTFAGGWNNCIVKEVGPDFVTLFRPYGTTANFTCGNRVICYVGIEEFPIPIQSTVEYDLVERGNLS